MPKLALAFSYNGAHVKSVVGPIDAMKHLLMLIASIDHHNPDGRHDVIVSAIDFNLWTFRDEDERMLAWQVYRRARVVTSYPTQQDHQSGAYWALRMATEAAAAIEAEFLVVLAEDVLLTSHSPEALIELMGSADYIGSAWGDDCSLNTQVFACRVSAFANFATRRFVFDPCARTGICEHELWNRAHHLGLNLIRNESFRYFHSHNPDVFLTEAAARGVSIPLQPLMPSNMKISDLFSAFGSDKNTTHSYGPIYDRILDGRQGNPAPMLEIGIAYGSSMRAFRQFFTTATIHGIDVNPAAMIIGDGRIVTHCHHQVDAVAISRLGKDHGPFQLIIDDGSHDFRDVLLTYSLLINFLAPGGLYIIEDLQNPDWMDVFHAWPRCDVYDLRSEKGRGDDVMIVIRRD